MKTIVAGYDGTRAAEHALNRVAELAGAFDSQVVVVSVSAPEPLSTTPGAFGLMPYYPVDIGEPVAEHLQEQHREQVQAFFADKEIPVEFVGVAGQPAEEIVEVAERYSADLIVVGTREAGFVARLLGGGSVSQGVARRAHCDVLIVHPPD